MWIAIRLFAAFAAFISRHIRRVSLPRPAGDFRGARYYQKVYRNKKNITGYAVGARLQAPVLFRLHEEDDSDRLFKVLGFATEFQTGDSEFDPEVYVASDHPSLFDLLKESDTARAAIRKVLGSGFRRISADGNVLWIEKSASHEPFSEDLELLFELHSAFVELEARRQNYFDPFLVRAVAVEALTWSIAAYAAAALPDLLGHHEDYHLHSWQILVVGLAGSGIVLGLLLMLIFVLLRRSSKGHRILVEGALLLWFGLPVAGIQLASDLNRYFDGSDAVVVTARIARAEQRTHRGGRRGNYSTYHLILNHPASRPQIDLPSEIQVSHAVFRKAVSGHDVDLHIGRGCLSVPWYREIVVR